MCHLYLLEYSELRELNLRRSDRQGVQDNWNKYQVQYYCKRKDGPDNHLPEVSEREKAWERRRNGEAAELVKVRSQIVDREERRKEVQRRRFEGHQDPTERGRDSVIFAIHLSASVEIAQTGRLGMMATACHAASAVAFLIPQSSNARKAFRAPQNHATLAVQPTPLTDGKRRGEVPPFLLTMHTFLGRHTFSFGSSRRNGIVLKGGLDTQHLHLHFEMQTSLLLLTDTSNSGTWVSTTCSAPTLVRQRTWPVLSTTSIALGDTQQYRFELRLANDLRGTEAFLQSFRRYALSLELSASLCIKPLASIRDLLLMYGGLYFRLHQVGPAGYEKINTCLRLSDARLFAVKSVTDEGVVTRPTQITSLSRRSQPGEEADLLRNLRHPHIIGFVDTFTHGHEWYICTDFIANGSLASILSQRSKPSLRASTVQNIVKQCLLALKYLHGRGVSHGSIRFESILVQTSAPVHILLCNFECSRQGTDATGIQADFRDLGNVMAAMLNHVADLPDDAAPWANLLAGLQECDPRFPSSADKCLADPWLLGKREGKRGRIEDGLEEGRPNKRLTEASV